MKIKPIIAPTACDFRTSAWLLVILLCIVGCSGVTNNVQQPTPFNPTPTLNEVLVTETFVWEPTRITQQPTNSPIPSPQPSSTTILPTLAPTHPPTLTPTPPLPSPKPTSTKINSGDLSDEEFLNRIQQSTFQYFWHEVNPETGLIKDRSTPSSPASIAAIGFGLSAIVVGETRGWVSKEAAYARVLKTLQTLDRLQQSSDTSAESNHGFFYHFTDPNTGRRVWDSELSSIDTALLIAGVVHTGQHFADTEVSRLAEGIYKRVEWDWMLNGGATLSHGWKPESGFLPYRWEGYNEAALLYLLAIGSPTYPIPATSWEAWGKTFQRGNYKGPDFIYVSTGSLFVYQYSHIWVDFREKRDSYANYWENSKLAIQANRQFVIDNQGTCKTYGENTWGLTASDGPNGYMGYGAKPGTALNDCTIAPTSAGGSVALVPDLSIRALRFMYDTYGNKVWGKYGFKDAYNVDQDWWDEDYIGIDQGAIILMIENYRSGLIWREFMTNPYIIQALESTGFVNE